MKRAPTPRRCASATSGGSVWTAKAAPATPASRKLLRIAVVLPRPPPPGLSATSAKSRAGFAGSALASSMRRVASSIESRRGVKRWRAVPQVLGELARELVRRGLVAAGRDDDAHAGLRRVAEAEIAEHRDVEDRPADPALALGDRLAVGAAVGEQRHLRRQDRQLDEGLGGPRAGKELAHGAAGLVTALGEVDMRVGQVGDEEIGRLDHPARDVGVQVERRDDRDLRPDDCAHGGKQRALGIEVDGAAAGAMRLDVDAVDAGARPAGVPRRAARSGRRSPARRGRSRRRSSSRAEPAATARSRPWRGRSRRSRRDRAAPASARRRRCPRPRSSASGGTRPRPRPGRRRSIRA